MHFLEKMVQKSITLMNMLAGLLEPTSGDIVLNGNY